MIAAATLAGVGCGSRDRLRRSPGSFAKAARTQAASAATASPVRAPDLVARAICAGRSTARATCVMTCPPDQGCAVGKCVPACEAAVNSKSTIGCDYYVVDPDVIRATAPRAPASPRSSRTRGTRPWAISVDFGGQTLDASTFANSRRARAIDHVRAAPRRQDPARAGGHPLPQPARDQSSGLVTDCPAGITRRSATAGRCGARHGDRPGVSHRAAAPVVAYDIFPYGGGQSADEAPRCSCRPRRGTRTTSASTASAKARGGLPFLESWRRQDGTTVTITPSQHPRRPRVVAAPKGMPRTYNLSRGQVLQFSATMGAAALAILAGSVIQSNKPVGLWGGKTSLGMVACCDDSAHQQIPPVRALGSEYVGVATATATTAWRSRRRGASSAPSTAPSLTWEPAPPPGAPDDARARPGRRVHANGPVRREEPGRRVTRSTCRRT